jgi:hypothetical protein
VRFRAEDRPTICLYPCADSHFQNADGASTWNAPKRIQNQEILITGDDRGALAGLYGRRHDIVGAVATRWGSSGSGVTSRERLGEQLKGGPHINSALAELPLQDFTELVQQ